MLSQKNSSKHYKFNTITKPPPDTKVTYLTECLRWVGSSQGKGSQAVYIMSPSTLLDTFTCSPGMFKYIKGQYN